MAEPTENERAHGDGGLAAAARDRGSDSFTNTLESTRPDNPDFVLPDPHADDSIESYIGRVKEKTKEILRQG